MKPDIAMTVMCLFKAMGLIIVILINLYISYAPSRFTNVSENTIVAPQGSVRP